MGVRIFAVVVVLALAACSTTTVYHPTPQHPLAYRDVTRILKGSIGIGYYSPSF